MVNPRVRQVKLRVSTCNKQLQKVDAVEKIQKKTLNTTKKQTNKMKAYAREKEVLDGAGSISTPNVNVAVLEWVVAAYAKDLALKLHNLTSHCRLDF